MKYTQEYWEDTARVVKCIPELDDLNGSSVLISGATGMIGSSIADILLFLNRNHNADIRITLAGRSKERTAARFEGFEAGRDYTFLPFDAAGDTPLSFDAAYVIHCASNANPAIYTKQPVETMLANITGLHKLLSAAAAGGSRRLLYVSSSEVYGNTPDNRPYQESDYGYVDILNPRACYPSAKRAAETMCVSFTQEYGLETVIVRPGHIYGPSITQSDSRASAQFTRDAVNGRDIVMKSAGRQLRSYCYTLDCASAILTVLLCGKTCEAYNISNRNSVVTIHDLALELAEAVGKKVVFENPTAEEQKGYNLMDNSSLNAEKLEALGWTAIFDLSEGARKTVRML